LLSFIFGVYAVISSGYVLLKNPLEYTGCIAVFSAIAGIGVALGNNFGTFTFLTGAQINGTGNVCFVVNNVNFNPPATVDVVGLPLLMKNTGTTINGNSTLVLRIIYRYL
jgi:hypothetical protein